MLFSARQAHQTWGSINAFLGKAYIEGRKWAGMIDGCANLARRVLGAATPMLNEMGAGRAITAGVRGLSHYDQVPHQVMDVDERTRGHISRIGRTVPELNIGF